MRKYITKAWNKVKKMFGITTECETIIWARLQSIGGAVMAALAVMDWSPLISIASVEGFDPRQVVILGLLFLFSGIGTELARRMRDWDLQKVKRAKALDAEDDDYESYEKQL